MISGECQKLCNESRIRIEENGKKAIFLNPDHADFVLTKVDGCVIKNTTAADYLLSKEMVGCVCVELKGKNVERATVQVAQTLRDLKSVVGSNVAGLVVCSQYPRASTYVQRAKQAFAREFNAPLHIVSRNAEFVFENVLSFRGPCGR